VSPVLLRAVGKGIVAELTHIPGVTTFKFDAVRSRVKGTRDFDLNTVLSCDLLNRSRSAGYVPSQRQWKRAASHARGRAVATPQPCTTTMKLLDPL
jgi:hypothetical protein